MGAGSFRIALQLLVAAAGAERSSATAHRRDFTHQLKTDDAMGGFVRVTTTTCADNGHAIITEHAECSQAAAAHSDKVTWGPNGGFADVVDGCSIRDATQLFDNAEKTCKPGISTPEWVPGANGKATCTCTAWQPCFCRRRSLASRWGAAFLVLAAAASVLYAGGGFALGRSQGRRAAAGPAGALAVHPHFAQWCTLAGLARDGVAYARACAAGGRAAAAGAARPAVADSPKKAARGKAKKAAREPKPRDAGSAKAPAGGGGPAAGGLEEPLASVAAEGAPAGGPAASGTAAGGGGRWVHVPT
jgi:hypothetical protein